MIQPQPLIALEDVEAGSRWFQSVLGVTSGHGGSDYEMLMNGDVMIAQLHDWEADEHPFLGDAGDPSRGNGVLLWFATDQFDGVLSRIEAVGAVVLQGPLLNANSGLREVWLEGPERYKVVVAGA